MIPNASPKLVGSPRPDSINSIEGIKLTSPLSSSDRLSTSSVHSTTSVSSATVISLSNGWKECRDESTGESYFYNSKGDISWERPDSIDKYNREIENGSQTSKDYKTTHNNTSSDYDRASKCEGQIGSILIRGPNTSDGDRQGLNRSLVLRHLRGLKCLAEPAHEARRQGVQEKPLQQVEEY